MMGDFRDELHRVNSQTRPVHLQLAVGSLQLL